MKTRSEIREALWLFAGAAILIAVIALVFRFRIERDAGEVFAARTRRAGTVERMLAGLASAAEAEKSAVLAVTDDESRAYAETARLTSIEVERERRELAGLLTSEGTAGEQDALAAFGECFAELRRIDDGLLDLAVRNTNLKATALTFGPAADAARETSEALDRVAGSDSGRRAFLVRGAQIGVLRLQVLLPLHIAEESDGKMTEIETRIAGEDLAVRSALAALATLPELGGSADLATAVARYARFGELRGQILALSRENSNVRSLTISLGQKARTMRLCREALVTLRQAILSEGEPGVTHPPTPKPR